MYRYFWGRFVLISSWGALLSIRQNSGKLFLVIGIVGNLLLLGYKYTAFLENINTLTGMAYDIPNIILPLEFLSLPLRRRHI